MTRITKKFPKSLLSSLVLLFVMSLAGSALAAAKPHVIINKPGQGARPMMLDLHGGFSHFGTGLSVGARFSIPIVENGFVPPINNTVSITFGGDFYWVKLDRDRYAAAVGFPVTLQWRFLFTDKLSAFGEMGANIFLHPDLIAGDGWFWYPGSWVIAAIGGRFKINESISLVGRLGNPYSSFGASFTF